MFEIVVAITSLLEIVIDVLTCIEYYRSNEQAFVTYHFSNFTSAWHAPNVFCRAEIDNKHVLETISILAA